MALATTDSKDGVSFTGARTANTISFVLLGGKYGWGTTAPSTSSTLQIIMPDASAVNVIAAVTAAGYTVLDLVPGSYQLIFTATGDTAGFVQKIPYNPSY